MIFLKTLAFAFGLALGGGLLYALAVSESARLVAMFLLGAFLFGSTVLLTALAVNKQWSKVIGEQKTVHTHRYSINGPSGGPPAFEPPERQQELLPPLVWPEAMTQVDSDDETIA